MIDQTAIFVNKNNFFYTMVMNGYEYNEPESYGDLTNLYYFAEDYLENNLDYVKYY